MKQLQFPKNGIIPCTGFEVHLVRKKTKESEVHIRVRRSPEHTLIAEVSHADLLSYDARDHRIADDGRSIEMMWYTNTMRTSQSSSTEWNTLILGIDDGALFGLATHSLTNHGDSDVDVDPEWERSLDKIFQVPKTFERIQRVHGGQITRYGFLHLLSLEMSWERLLDAHKTAQELFQAPKEAIAPIEGTPSLFSEGYHVAGKHHLVQYNSDGRRGFFLSGTLSSPFYPPLVLDPADKERVFFAQFDPILLGKQLVLNEEEA